MSDDEEDENLKRENLRCIAEDYKNEEDAGKGQR